MEKITAVLLGAGGRGKKIYGSYVKNHPYEIQIVAVAEPNRERMEEFRKEHSIHDEMCFDTWEKLLEKPKMADTALVCTQDRMHFAPTIKALEKGYHILLEKPMSPDPFECITIDECAEKYHRILSICHTLRYTSFFSTLKKLLDEGKIGSLVSIQHNENVAHWHQAHSFVRGSWRNLKESSPMILSKCCHDMDIMLWLAGADCERISSFGSLAYFRKECAPQGAPQRCLDGCPVESECPYYAPKIYLTEYTGWPTFAITTDMSMESRIQALKEGPYGRCVYHCDNDVVDHQVVNMEFANKVTAAFTMCAFTKDCNRTIKLMGTKGEIRGDMEKNEIEVLDFITGNRDVITLKKSEYGHGGGDYGVIHDFIRLVQQDGEVQSLTSASVSLQSHLMAFAAEKARLESKVIDMKEYFKEIKAQ